MYTFSASLSSITKEEKSKNNARGQAINYSAATDIIGAKVAEKLKKMVSVMSDEYITPNAQEKSLLRIHIYEIWKIMKICQKKIIVECNQHGVS